MKKNILVVDDSALMRRVICDIINSDESFQVVDTGRDGIDAYEKIKANKYDAMVLDINMPRMDGLELLKKLQSEKIEILTIMASTLTVEGSKETIEALELGAVDFVTKPGNIIEAKGEDFSTSLLKVLNAVLRTTKIYRPSFPKTLVTRTTSTLPQKSDVKGGNKLIALACSTGGPKSLQSVIPLLPEKMDAPMVLVQHMPAGFTKSMADRLNELSKVNVKEAEDGDVLQKGWVYVAPGGKHMKIIRNGATHKVRLEETPPIGGLRPCADIMYKSLTDSGFDEIVCVVLTGMGADGTEGILELKKGKKIFTISQDEATCVVYGMPRAIAESGVVNKVVSLNDVASTIITNVGVQ